MRDVEDMTNGLNFLLAGLKPYLSFISRTLKRQKGTKHRSIHPVINPVEKKLSSIRKKQEKDSPRNIPCFCITLKNLMMTLEEGPKNY